MSHCSTLHLALIYYLLSSAAALSSLCRERHIHLHLHKRSSRAKVIRLLSINKSFELELSALPNSPVRYSSRSAASMIKNCSAEDGLLIITTDASGRGGGSKHDGLAAVLRIRHGVSKLTNVSEAMDSEVDLLDTVSRRRAPSRKDSNEVAAISLGMKRAMQTIPPSWRKKVLIISDSELSLRFYCGDNHESRDGSETHRRILNRLVMESPEGVFFTKIRSSSRGIGMIGSTTANGDNKTWDGIGFIDHDAADYLSSATRSKPNIKPDFDSEGSLCLEALPFKAVCSLRPNDLEWLENSDDVVVETELQPKRGDGSKQWNKITVRGSDARNEQKTRNERKQRMVMELLGISDVEAL